MPFGKFYNQYICKHQWRITGNTLNIGFVLGGTSPIVLGHLTETHHDQSTPPIHLVCFITTKGTFQSI